MPWTYSCEEPLKVHFENIFVLCLMLLVEMSVGAPVFAGRCFL